jgi:hypothetical protein
MYKNGGDYSARRENGARGKSPSRRDQPSSNYFPSQRSNATSTSSSSNARSASMQREKTSSRMNVAGSEINGKTNASQVGATSLIKSNMKQRRALARERWNILKQVIHF